MRARETEDAGRVVRFQHRWVPYSRISNNLRRAVLAAEDGAFFQHEGVDYAELRKVIEEAFETGEELRGASTLTQQLAKNLYLSPSRDPLRKLRELIITRRLESSLSKTRIFEIYLNVVEWGDGIWGAEAAARAHFGVSASALSREQAALLAGALINPIRYSPSNPPGRLRRRQQIILGRMNRYDPPPAEVVAPVEPPQAPEGVPTENGVPAGAPMPLPEITVPLPDAVPSVVLPEPPPAN